MASSADQNNELSALDSDGGSIYTNSQDIWKNDCIIRVFDHSVLG